MKLFELYADLSLNSKEFDDGVKNASKAGQALQNGISAISAKTVALGHFMYDAGKVAIKAAANFAKSIIEEYAETEQLIGGVQTIFKESASDVIANAERAYKTAGMSANQYMQTVTSFSSSLMQSLKGNTEEAARYADMAILDMADNANKFGTDMGLIQNAYQGFAKQNYTMLDNLKLGYGGTQKEMQRLLKDAQKIQRANGVNVKYNIKNMDDIIEAIHVIQESMGVTGTTAAEASDTWAGSLASFKAAWENTLAGLGNKDADLGSLFRALYSTGKTFLGNTVEIVDDIADNAWDGLQSLKGGFIKAWNTSMPDAVATGANSIITSINTIFGTNIPKIESVELPTWEELSESVSTWWAGVRGGLETAAKWTLGIFTNPTETAEDMKAAFSAWWTGTAKPAIEAAAQWTLTLFTAPTESQEAIIAVVSKWWSTAGEWVSNACSWVLQLFGVPTETAEQIKSIISTWWNGIASVFADVCKVIFSLAAGDTETAKAVVLSWWEAIKEAVASLLQVGFDLIAPSIVETIAKLKEWWNQVKKSLDFVVEPTATVHTSESGATLGGGGRSFSGAGFATGLDYVPYNNFAARLHEGEAVLTASEAAKWRMGNIEGTAPSVDLSPIESLLSQILSAAQRPVPAVIDGNSVYQYVSRRQARAISTAAKI